MYREPLDAVPLWLMFVGTIALAGVALEAGYRLGRWRHRLSSEEKEAPVGAMVGSILALFAFLLAFTFGTAGSRYESRRQAVLEEANAIGTTYLRARLLHEPQRSASEKLLREYVDVRVDGLKSGQVGAMVARSEEIHSALWREAVKEAEAHPTPVTALYLASLNQMIDVHATRLQFGITNRIPHTIWTGLLALSFLGMFSVGYQAGLSTTRRSPAMIVLILSFAGVLFLIADLDRPQDGFISVNQEAMINLQASMHAGKQ